MEPPRELSPLRPTGDANTTFDQVTTGRVGRPLVATKEPVGTVAGPHAPRRGGPAWLGARTSARARARPVIMIASGKSRGAAHGGNAEDRCDPGRRCRRLQPARRRGRGGNAGAAAGAAQRSDRSRDRRASWTRRQAHRRRRSHRVSQRRRRGALRDRSAERHGRAQRRACRRSGGSSFASESILGDVVEEADGDLMGDGVNIAARLEGLAEPGGVCLSEDA